MAKIELRAYNREIETVIEHGQIEEAIAHCKYILRFFPKHIDTYRLLGNAYIESQRYSEAADILQRILSVLPDDFFAQIGMSIVREDEGNLDAAIFHMEHAHEIQPSNGAVQDELRRLYGRRDGVEPPRLRLTRGALVRLYAKGDLYRQAIAEIRAALAEDPNRFDLEVILARMYSLLGQKVEAIDVASRLVSKLPYCMEANRILAEILPTTSRAEDAKTYQQRVFALDPYQVYISPNAPTSNLVPDNAVTLDRLEFQPAAAGEVQPAWAQNAGIALLGGAEKVETLPDWLTPPPEVEQSSETGLTGQTAFLKEQTEGSTPAISSEVPDWMQETGWAGSTQAIQENANPEEEAATPAELPDWLKSMAPQEETAPQSQENEPKLDWVDQILPQNGAAPGNEFAFPVVEGLTTDNQDLTAVSQPSQGQAIEAPGTGFEESLPPWLTLPEAETTATGQVPENIAQESTSSIIEAQSPEVESAVELPAAIIENLAAPVPEPKVEPVSSESLAEPALPTAETEQIPPQTLAESIAPAAEVEPVLPKAQAEPASPVTEIVPVTSEALSELTLPAAQAEQVPSEALVELALPSEVAEKVPSEALTEPASPAADIEQFPQETVPEAPVAEVIESTPTEGITEPVIVPVELAAEAQPDWNDLNAAMAWLEGLAAKQGADQETLSTTEEQRSEIPPSWVTREVEKSQEETQVAPATPAPVEVQPVQAVVSEISTDISAEEPVSEFSSESVAQAVAETPGSPEVEPIAEISTPVIEQTLPETLSPEKIPEMPTLEIEPLAVEPVVSLTPVASAEPVEAPVDLPSSAPAESTAIDQQTASKKKTAPLKLPVEPAPAKDMDGDAAFAWLESLAAQQGADEGSLSTSIEERQGPPPTWVLEQGEVENKAQGVPDISEAAPTISETVIQEPQAFHAEVQLVSPEIAPTSELPVIEVPALSEEAIQPVETGGWIKEPEQPAAPQTPFEVVPPVPTALPEEEPLPSWLKDINQPPSGTRELVAPESMDDFPDWLKGFETPSETSSPPASDETISVSTWLQEQENPTPEESKPLATVAEPVLSLEENPLQPVTEPTAAVPVEPAPFQGFPTSENPLIAQAQTDLAAGNIDTALHSYNQAIEQGQNLNTVIQNLKDALYRHPVEISLWQTLGDAYMRNDQIQDALDAYTKAEELLW